MGVSSSKALCAWLVGGAAVYTTSSTAFYRKGLSPPSGSRGSNRCVSVPEALHRRIAGPQRTKLRLAAASLAPKWPFPVVKPASYLDSGPLNNPDCRDGSGLVEGPCCCGIDVRKDTAFAGLHPPLSRIVGVGPKE